MATQTATNVVVDVETAKLVDFLQTINKGTFGTTLITATFPTMNKRNNPYHGRVIKTTYMTNVAIGYSYENAVNNRLNREGKDNDFESQKPFGKHWVEGMENILLESDKDNSQKYLRVTFLPNSYIKSVYLIDNKIATDNEVELIKTFLPKSNKPGNQGLENGNEVIVRDYKLNGILVLTQGKKEYNVFSDQMDIPSIKQFFKS